jgi:aspartyl-tRNA(Asn)/glutamyl-tRNA(Gln) amidotransferase subunit A
MPQAIATLSAIALIEAYKAGRLSPVDVIEASLERLAEVDPALNAFRMVDPATGRVMAEASAARWRRGTPMGLLDGVPVAVKDTNQVSGWPMRFGSLTTPDTPASGDTPGVARLREAGAVFFGKTNTPEYGWKGLTDSLIAGITRNPWDPAKTPGGSSGGSAIAVATGICPIATGGDGGGSVRIPASFTGTFGLKPTYARVPALANPLAPLVTFSCQTRTVADTALALTIISRPDPNDGFPLPCSPEDFSAGLERGVKGLRIAISRDLGFPVVSDDVASCLQDGIDVLARAGATMTDVALDLSWTRPLVGTIWRSGYGSILGSLPKGDLGKLEPALHALFESAGRISGQELQSAHDGLRRLTAQMQALHQDFDLLVTPTMPIAPFDAGRDVPDDRFAEWFDWSPMTWPFNLSRQPAASVPCGFTPADLPVGLQVVGPLWSEALILAACRVVERDLPQPMATTRRYL